MAVPSKKDIDKKAKELEKHLKQLDETGRLTEKKLTSMLISAIRQVWMSAPNKLAKIEQARIPDMNPKTRTKWLFQCEHCKGFFKLSDIEVDHIEGNHTFTKLSDFENYCDKILNASLDEMQILCVEDHATKTYLEKHGLTWEEASKIKKAIKLEKEIEGNGKGAANRAKKYLMSKGFKASEVSNYTKRRECFIKLIEERG